MAARQTISPVNFNAAATTGGSLPSAPSAGIDAAGAGGTTFGTAWTGLEGVQFVNNGEIILWYYNGATSCNAYILIGQKAAGVVPTYTTFTVALATTGYGWLGPFSPAGFDQQDSTAHSAAPGGVIGTSGVGLCCVDFSATTTLSVRAYQLIPQVP